MSDVNTNDDDESLTDEDLNEVAGGVSGPGPLIGEAIVGEAG